ncbi:MAG: phasin family protein [Azonexus sp.]|nr:phasin family protein [Azonexus sp.]
MLTPLETLHRQADSYAALYSLMLENSSRYLDLQLAAAKSSIALTRQHLSNDVTEATPATMIQACSELIQDNLNELAQFARESGALSSATQREMGRLIGVQWDDSKQMMAQLLEGQMAFLKAMHPARNA